jgi:hypothetical protein
MEVHKSEYVVVYFEKKNKLLGKRWFKTTQQMTDKEFKKEMSIYGELVKKYKPNKELVDTKEFLYAIAPQQQDWVNENVFTIYIKEGLSKAAFVSSEDFIAQLSLEQAMDETKGKYLTKQYFSTEKAAREWLLSND